MLEWILEDLVRQNVSITVGEGVDAAAGSLVLRMSRVKKLEVAARLGQGHDRPAAGHVEGRRRAVVSGSRVGVRGGRVRKQNLCPRAMCMGDRVISQEELAAADGADGRPIWFAYAGVVYDASNSRHWRTGRHFSRHPAGTDLTGALQKAPHGHGFLERLPRVGVLGQTATPD